MLVYSMAGMIAEIMEGLKCKLSDKYLFEIAELKEKYFEIAKSLGRRFIFNEKKGNIKI
ncbi:MAG: hypothetical protein KatS3mg068_2659 [Candidatus Sericytochromatia bacterium]|nr:MAG: hypothetical protein KatS3mg068_2659 [Candidatus Sericytochromatia bacterium]